MSLTNLAAKGVSKKLTSNNNLSNLLASNLPSHLKYKIMAMSTKANIARQAAIKAQKTRGSRQKEKQAYVFAVLNLLNAYKSLNNRKFNNARERLFFLNRKYGFGNRSILMLLNELPERLNVINRINLGNRPRKATIEAATKRETNERYRREHNIRRALNTLAARAPNRYPPLMRLRRLVTRRN